eukprot:jgi/Orpsp1_1/1184009/evm.model.c7180000087630.1
MVQDTGASEDVYLLYYKFIIPRNIENSDKAIQTAIKILEMVNKGQLEEYIKNEARFIGQFG